MGATDELELVKRRARWCLAHNDFVCNPTTEIKWTKVEGASTAMNLQDILEHAQFFALTKEPQNLRANVAECLGGDIDLVVNSMYSGETQCMCTFRTVVFGGSNAGKLLIELTITEERLRV